MRRKPRRPPGLFSLGPNTRLAPRVRHAAVSSRSIRRIIPEARLSRDREGAVHEPRPYAARTVSIL
jgi:hypothetical protein